VRYESVVTNSVQPKQKVDNRVLKRFRVFAWILVFSFLLSAFCFVFRAPLLTAAATAWVVDEPVTKADAIVVLGGGLENRPFAAAKLFHDGLAPKILFMDVKLSPTTELGITLPEAELTRRVLLSNNVPETAIEAIGNGVTSTYDESRAVRAWVEKTGAKSIIISTDPFHTRRARWLFRKELKGTGARICLVAAARREYQASNWWQHEQGLIDFQNEFLKSVYYHCKY
jgi:uncharacterized SAM-binding protein YcdF (DUF218 family)